MPQYAPPLRDMQFVLHEVLDPVGQLQACPPHAELCLLYTSDAADERSSVDLGGRRLIKNKNNKKTKKENKQRIT